MSIQPQYLVRGADGRPLPPADLVERIKRYDPRVGLFYTNASWAIIETWKDDDPRRQWIQSGDMQPEFAFDICGYLPITCSLDEALPYIERELRNVSADQFQALRATVAHWNDVEVDGATEAAVLGAVSDALDRSDIVTPGISTAVAVDLTPEPKSAEKPGDRFAAARAAKAAKRAASA